MQLLHNAGYTALVQVMICRDRLQRAQMREAGEALLSAGQTQRQVAAALGVARSTFQDWQQASAGEAVPAGLAEFIA